MFGSVPRWVFCEIFATGFNLFQFKNYSNNSLSRDKYFMGVPCMKEIVYLVEIKNSLEKKR